MNRDAVKYLLDGLDKSLNSNTAFLQFENAKITGSELPEFLLSKLHSGAFSEEMLRNDVDRNLYTYTFFDYSQDTLIMNKNTGNFWNGNGELKITTITSLQAKQDLLDLLTVCERFSPKSQPLPVETATQLVIQFMDSLGTEENILFYVVEPDFLFTVEENNEERPGYFENFGRDYVLMILRKEESILNILLTNGYG